MSDIEDLYFAYGSNMDPEQMGHRDLGWTRAEGAVLSGYRLAFDFDARSRWLGGAANVVPDEDMSVEGVLYHLDGDIAVMDGWEGGYRRIQVRVVLLNDGTEREAWTYEVIDKGEHMNPSEVYVDQMLRGAREFGLSDDYIRELEGHRTRGCEELGNHVFSLRAMARSDRPLAVSDLVVTLEMPEAMAREILSDLDGWGWLVPAGDQGGYVVPEERSHRAPWVLR